MAYGYKKCKGNGCENLIPSARSKQLYCQKCLAKIKAEDDGDVETQTGPVDLESNL